MKFTLKAAVLFAVLAVVNSPVFAALNEPPPNNPLLDLAGHTVPGSTPQLYTANFTATGTSTTITFAFRHDPGFFGFDNASVVDTTSSSGNLLTNGSFETGNASGWTFFNPYNASFAGHVTGSTGGLTPQDGSYQWYDGAVGAYDGIDQVITTNIGDSYTLSFYLSQYDTNGVPYTKFQALSNNGGVGTYGNGVDALAYALTNGTPTVSPVPEPSTYAMLLVGLGLIGFVSYRRKNGSSRMMMAV